MKDLKFAASLVAVGLAFSFGAANATTTVENLTVTGSGFNGTPPVPNLDVSFNITYDSSTGLFSDPELTSANVPYSLPLSLSQSSLTSIVNSLEVSSGTKFNFDFITIGNSFSPQSVAYTEGGTTYTATSINAIYDGSPGTPLSAVPEPATWAMMMLGVAGLGLALRRRRTADTVFA